MMTDVEFGKAVKLKRLQQGLSQNALAQKVHMSNTTVNAVERALHEFQPKTKMALAVALGIDPEEWL